MASVILAVLVVALLACGSSATPVETGAGDDQSSRLLETLSNLPLSFKEEGVWFADYARAQELAGAPQPTSLAEFLALSEDERQAYQTARRGLILGPGLLGAIREDARGWDDSLGFSRYSVAVAVSTGEISSVAPPVEAAYMILDFDQARLRQELLDLGYVERSENGVSFYDSIPALTLETTRSNPMAFTAFNHMRRVVVGDGTLATSGVRLVDLIPSFPAVALGEAPSLGDDDAFSRLAVSLGDPLSAALLTRSAVLEPEAAKPTRYEKPDDWGGLNRWEALGMGYGISEGAPWMALSLFYPDPDAAEADAEELTRRMSDYDSALSMTHPGLRKEQLAAMLRDGKQPIDAICGDLDSTYTSNDKSSTLTMRCDTKDASASSLWWSLLLDMRDLGFLLP